MPDHHLLEAERTFLQQNAHRFRRKYPKKFLLIKGTKLIGTYDTHDDAVSAAVKRYQPDEPVLVRPADNPDDPVLDNLALSLGIPISCPS